MATFSSTVSRQRFYNLDGIPKKALVRRRKRQGTSAEETVTLITMSRESEISLQPPQLPPKEGNQRSVFKLKETGKQRVRGTNSPHTTAKFGF
jgi:hypothetical protein